MHCFPAAVLGTSFWFLLAIIAPHPATLLVGPVIVSATVALAAFL